MVGLLPEAASTPPISRVAFITMPSLLRLRTPRPLSAAPSDWATLTGRRACSLRSCGTHVSYRGSSIHSALGPVEHATEPHRRGWLRRLAQRRDQPGCRATRPACVASCETHQQTTPSRSGRLSEGARLLCRL